MTLEQRVGQVFMVGTAATGSGSDVQRLIVTQHVGGVFLKGRSGRGVAATASLSKRLQAWSKGSQLLVGTDQEGGAVQVLRGRGFDQMPTATTQGRWTAGTLRASSARWGNQLHAAGVNLNLAPVADVVPTSLGTGNAAIGRYHRQFGATPARVTAGSTAFLQGMRGARVLTAVKHYPGLGAVRDNTDSAPVVVDRITTATSASLQPFQAAITQGTQLVMVSNATYARIDPKRPASFSPTVMNLLRHNGFHGVIISDDLSAARVLARYGQGRRAVNLLAAGGDLVLTVSAPAATAMVAAVLQRARTDQAFRARVDQAALRVLTMKLSAGLLAPGHGCR